MTPKPWTHPRVMVCRLQRILKASFQLMGSFAFLLAVRQKLSATRCSESLPKLSSVFLAHSNDISMDDHRRLLNPLGRHLHVLEIYLCREVSQIASITQ